MSVEGVGNILSMLAQIYNYLPFPVPFEEMYGDKKDCYGVEWWYDRAKEIDKENKRRMKKK